MTAQILQLRDYKSPEQRQPAVEGLREAVATLPVLSVPSDFPIQYRRDDTAPCEMDSGDCA